MNKGFLKYAVLIYAGMLALLYGIVAAGQILGFTGLYRRDMVFVLALGLAAQSAIWIIRRKN